MAITVNDWYDKYRPCEDWKKPGLLYSPVPEKDMLIRVKVKTSAEIGICDIVSVIETGDDETDLYIATVSADNSVVPMFWIPDTERNREQLAKDNSVDDVSSLTKSTAKFLTNSYIDAYLLFPGMIISCKLADSQTVKPGVKLQSAGSGKFDVYATVNARIGHILGQVPNEAALNWIAVMVTF